MKFRFMVHGVKHLFRTIGSKVVRFRQDSLFMSI
jgi:hypothetical protein